MKTVIFCSLLLFFSSFFLVRATFLLLLFFPPVSLYVCACVRISFALLCTYPLSPPCSNVNDICMLYSNCNKKRTSTFGRYHTEFIWFFRSSLVRFHSFYFCFCFILILVRGSSYIEKKARTFITAVTIAATNHCCTTEWCFE